jgi:hypothetical protein
LSALRLSGRLRVMVATPSARPYSTVVRVIWPLPL